MKYDTAVFIGRFQPFHFGHKYIIEQALKIAEEVIVIVGSSFAAPSVRNPFSFDVRKAMIKAEFPDDRIKVVGLMDYPYNDTKWIKNVKSLVEENRSMSSFPQSTVLVGYGKDETSYYLKMFPSWDSFDPGEAKLVPGKMINATDIRNRFYAHKTHFVQEDFIPSKARNVLNSRYWSINEDGFDVSCSDVWQTILDEYDFSVKYEADFGVNIFGKKPIHMTVDALVTQADKILLIRRGKLPGKNLWALPGGFLEPDETLMTGIIRELREETKLKVPEPVLLGSIKNSKTFDSVRRSIRGRVITHATHFKLNDDKPLPKVKGSDDAWHAEWVDIEKVDPEKMFEDHYGIIDYFLNIA